MQELCLYLLQLNTHLSESNNIRAIDANVQVPARNQKLCPGRQVCVKLQLAAQLLPLKIFRRYHPLPPLPPPVSNSSCLFLGCLSLYTSCCTVLLHFSRYCTVRLKLFSLFFVCFLKYIICVKNITNLLQYSTI